MDMSSSIGDKEERIVMAKMSHSKQCDQDGMIVPETTSYLDQEYLEDFQSLSRLPYMKSINAFNRFCVQALSYVSRIDVCACSGRERRADWSLPGDVKHVRDYNLVIGWRLFPGPIAIALRWLGLGPFKISAWKQRQRYLWIPRLARILYFVFSFHLLVNLYFQYLYDFDRIKLININKRYQDYLRWELELYKDLLTNRSRATKSMLDLIGAPFSNYGITVECFYLYTIICGFLVYYMGPVFFSTVVPFDLHIGRELLDEQNETRHFEKLVQEQVDKYVESSRMFNEISFWKESNSVNTAINRVSNGLISRADQGMRFLQLPRKQRQQQVTASNWQRSRGSSPISVRYKMARLDRDHLDTCNRLDVMLAKEVLRPFNKTPGYMDRRSILMAVYHATIYIYVILMVKSLMYELLSHSDPSKPLRAQDYLFIISLLGILILLALTGNLCTTYFFAATLDEIVAVNKIRKLIHRCIHVNSAEFISLDHQQQPQQHSNCLLASDRATSCNSSYTTDSHGFGATQDERQVCRSKISATVRTPTIAGRAYKPSHCGNVLNTNLLFLLMQYKIFVAQYLPVKSTIKCFIVFATLFSMTFPIILRIHLTYLNVFNVESIELYAVIWSLGVLVVFDCNIIPICYLYSRCVDLYRAMFSLSAHITTIESHPNGKGLYNQHAITTLLKELDHPDRMMDQFKARLLGFTSTYTTLVKIHFWWGLIELSILADRHSGGQGLIGSMFSDPFGVF